MHYVELPTKTAKFVELSLRLLRLHGVSTVSRVGLKRTKCKRDPYWFHSVGEGPHELYVSIPGPPNDPGLRVNIYSASSLGIRYDEQQIDQVLPLFQKWLVLDELADI